MSLNPTALDFVLRYRSPVPSNFNTEFESIAPDERRKAFDGIRPYHKHCGRMRVNPIDPVTYLRLKVWRRMKA